MLMLSRRYRIANARCMIAALVLVSPWLLSSTTGQSLPDAMVSQVSVCLENGAKASWEIGTRAQTILELNATQLSVLTPRTPLPPPSSLSGAQASSQASVEPVLQIASGVVANRDASNGYITGPQPLMKDGSAADPASVGVAVLLAHLFDQRDQNYLGAAKDQLDFLLGKVPRTKDGAISHRVEQVQLWSDFVYMVPPFLAYYGVTTNDSSLVHEAYNQIKLYRSYLRDPKAKNLWKHVLLGSSGNDEGHWSTGNAWAAAGMLRVLGTIQNSQYSCSMKSQRKDLANWVNEIHDAMYPHLDKATHLFPNYASRPLNTASSDPTNFLDAASTALLASTVYRLSLLWGIRTHISDAELSRTALSATDRLPGKANKVSYRHIYEDGWVYPVVNPYSYGEQGDRSPEAQAFMLQMHAAWRDWVADGSKGMNASEPRAQPNGVFKRICT